VEFEEKKASSLRRNSRSLFRMNITIWANPLIIRKNKRLSIHDK